MARRAGEVQSLRRAGEVDRMVAERGKLAVSEASGGSGIFEADGRINGMVAMRGGIGGMLAKQGGVDSGRGRGGEVDGGR